LLFRFSIFLLRAREKYRRFRGRRCGLRVLRRIEGRDWRTTKFP
jgi:hypothetical protein